MKKLIMMAGLVFAVLVAPIAASAATVGVGNESSSGSKSLPAGTIFHLSDGGNYGKCNNAWTYTCKTDIVVMYYSTRSGGTGTQTNPYIYNDCVFESCACPYNKYLSGDTCVACSTQQKRTNTVAIEDKSSYHTNTSCDKCLPEMLGMAPAAGVIVCYCPDNGTCANHQLTCNKNYYRSGSGVTSNYTCEACEAYATTDSAGATSHTECCYSTTQNFTDSIGTYHYSSKCCYTN